MSPDIPQPSSTTVEFWFRIDDVQRMFCLEDSHSAIKGVIFHRTGEVGLENAALAKT